jgi:hypothetical protein
MSRTSTVRTAPMNDIVRTEARHDEPHPAHRRCALRRWRSLPAAAPVRITVRPARVHRTVIRTRRVAVRGAGAASAHPLSKWAAPDAHPLSS